jgi:hypothetical protein
MTKRQFDLIKHLASKPLPLDAKMRGLYHPTRTIEQALLDVLKSRGILCAG